MMLPGGQVDIPPSPFLHLPKEVGSSFETIGVKEGKQSSWRRIYDSKKLFSTLFVLKIEVILAWLNATVKCWVERERLNIEERGYLTT